MYIHIYSIMGMRHSVDICILVGIFGMGIERSGHLDSFCCWTVGVCMALV